MGKVSNLVLTLLTPLIISSCVSTIPSRVISLKDVYDGKEDTHAYHWKGGLLPEDQCAFLYRDKRLDTEKDDWIPFFQGLALLHGEQELNLRRKEKPLHYDNELFTRDEQIAYCRIVDKTKIDYDLDHHQIAIPEEVTLTLDLLKKSSKYDHPERSLKYLDNLKIHYESTLF